jgi:CRP-like cAMP-binding protein
MLTQPCFKYTAEEITELLHLTSPDQSETNDRSSTMAKLLKLKNHLPLFDGIDAKIIETIFDDVAFEHYDQHTTIIHQGDMNHAIYILLHGSCTLQKNTKTIGMLNDGEIFGEMGIFYQETQPMNITVSSTKATVIRLTLNTKRSLKYPKTLLKFYRFSGKQWIGKL